MKHKCLCCQLLVFTLFCTKPSGCLLLVFPVFVVLWIMKPSGDGGESCSFRLGKRRSLSHCFDLTVSHGISRKCLKVQMGVKFWILFIWEVSGNERHSWWKFPFHLAASATAAPDRYALETDKNKIAPQLCAVLSSVAYQHLVYILIEITKWVCLPGQTVSAVSQSVIAVLTVALPSVSQPQACHFLRADKYSHW